MKIHKKLQWFFYKEASKPRNMRIMMILCKIRDIIGAPSHEDLLKMVDKYNEHK